MQWAGQVVRMDKDELPKKIWWTNPGSQRESPDRNQDGLTGLRKTQGNWVVEIGWRLPRIEVAADICLRRSSPPPPRSVEAIMLKCDNFEIPYLH